MKPPRPNAAVRAGGARRPAGAGLGAVEGSAKADAIRHAAYRCFRARGYHETTVDEICQTARVSKGSFYWHFKSKQEIFVSILEAWAAQVETELAKQFSPAIEHPDPLGAVTRALAVEAGRGRLIVPVWLDSLARFKHEPELRRALAGFHRRIRDAIARLLGHFLGGRYGERAIQGIAGTVLAAYLGLICQYLVDPNEAGFGEQLREFMPVLRSYLERARSERPGPPSAPVP
ncbi:MAG: TetR/AcrR family transcriptional regulator [Deltaproteobacteria bacterium]|nr:TetR/AcrR family transcriptional regulator [Deltaproteobacteria bacterium]